MITHIFDVGNTVVAVAFTDCFGVFHPESEPLTVISRQEVDNHSPHTRIKAVNQDQPGRSIEGNEAMYFIAASA